MSDDGRHDDELELDAGLFAAFDADDDEPQSVLARLSEDGRRLMPVLLRDADDDPTPVHRAPPIAKRRGAEGRYQVMGEIARGGLGLVLKGHDVDLGRDVAMKVIREEHENDPAVIERFVEEAQIGGQLQHPGIVPVYEIGVDRRSKPYFTMKLVKGQTLAAVLAARRDVRDNRRKVMNVFASVCQTMAYAHTRGVIHRDLKPSNIMVGAFGEVLVVDWGMGKVLGADRTPSTVDVPADQTVVSTVRSHEGSGSLIGSVMGTPRYMPPEQARGDIERVDTRSDVFALGAILCEILTGKPPYPGENAHAQAAVAKLDDALERLGACGVDAELVSITKRCLSAAPEDRPADAQVLADEITAHLAAADERAKRAQVDAVDAKRRAAEEEARAERERAEAERERERADLEAAEAAHAVRARRLTRLLATAALLVVTLGAGGWLFLEAAAQDRIDQANADVREALDEASGLRGKAATTGDVRDWEAARSAAAHAATLASADGVEPTTRTRALAIETEVDAETIAARAKAAEDEKDRALVARLDEIREELADEWDRAAGRVAYMEAFKDYGIDFDALDSETAAEAVRASAVFDDVIEALDIWDAICSSSDPFRPLPVLRLADKDPVRAQIREAEDADVLRSIADTIEMDTPVETLLQLVEALKRADALEAAADLAVRVQRVYPDDYWANYRAHVAVVLLDPPRREEALRYLAACIALRPNAVVPRANRVVELRDLGRLDEALAEAHRIIEIAPESSRGHARVGELLIAKNEHAKAIPALREAIRLEPRSAIAHHQLAFALWGAGDHEGALRANETALTLPMDDHLMSRVHNNLGSELAELGTDDERALAHFRESIRLDPSYWSPRAGIAHLQHRRGDTDAAIATLREAIALDPDEWRAWVSIATWAPDDEESIERLRALAANLDSAEALDALVMLLITRGRDTLHELQTLVRMDPKNQKAWFNLGVLYQRRHDHDRQLHAYQNALRLEGPVLRANILLGIRNGLWGRGQAEEAIPVGLEGVEALLAALDAASADKRSVLEQSATAEINVLIGHLIGTGQPEAAVEWVERLAEHDAYDEWTAFHREVIAHAERLPEPPVLTGSEPRLVLVHLAMIAIHRGHLELGLDLLRTVDTPADPNVRMTAAVACLRAADARREGRTPAEWRQAALSLLETRYQIMRSLPAAARASMWGYWLEIPELQATRNPSGWSKGEASDWAILWKRVDRALRKARKQAEEAARPK